MKKTEVQGVWEIFPRSQITKQILTKAAWLQFIPVITTSQYDMYDIYDINHKNEIQGKKKMSSLSYTYQLQKLENVI